jgi:16S rRNA processing protein RimM
MTSPAAEGPKRVALAAVAGAHGIKGELRLKLFAESVASLKAHKSVYVGGELRQIRDLRDANKTAIARLDGINDRSAAEALRGLLIEVDREALPPLEEGEYYHADLVGLPCVGFSDEPLGTVAAIENFGAGDLD